MQKITVQVDLTYASKHLEQLYTGLEILAAKGDINLIYSILTLTR